MSLKSDMEAIVDGLNDFSEGDMCFALSYQDKNAFVLMEQHLGNGYRSVKIFRIPNLRKFLKRIESDDAVDNDDSVNEVLEILDTHYLHITFE